MSKAMNTRLTTTEEQIAKYGPACIIDARDLTIEDGAFNSKMFNDPRCKIHEATEDVSIS